MEEVGEDTKSELLVFKDGKLFSTGGKSKVIESVEEYERLVR